MVNRNKIFKKYIKHKFFWLFISPENGKILLLHTLNIHRKTRKYILTNVIPVFFKIAGKIIQKSYFIWSFWYFLFSWPPENFSIFFSNFPNVHYFLQCVYVLYLTMCETCWIDDIKSLYFFYVYTPRKNLKSVLLFSLQNLSIADLKVFCFSLFRIFQLPT